MPDITITVPTSHVPALVRAAEAKLDALGIDRSGMTAVQKGRRYIAEVLKDVVRNDARAVAVAAAQPSIDTAVNTNVDDIV
jgi:hypothetical protein